jgi:hypothetical protein
MPGTELQTTLKEFQQRTSSLLAKTGVLDKVMRTHFLLAQSKAARP